MTHKTNFSACAKAASCVFLEGVMTLLSVGGKCFGGLAALLATYSWSPASNVSSEVVKHTSADQAATELSPSACKWAQTNTDWNPDACNSLAIRHYSPSEAAVDLALATYCALQYKTDCILGLEVGLQIPAAFVYDSLKGMKMLVAPVVNFDANATDSPKNIKVSNPSDLTNFKVFTFHETLDVEFIDGSTQMMQTERMQGAAAYCVQYLRHTVNSSCWQKLD